MLTQRQLFLQRLAPTSPGPLLLEIEKGEGVYLYDTKGKAYLDLIAGIGVSGLGHCHPKVTEAVKKQTDRYLHTMVYGEYVLSPQVQLADLMIQNLPENLNSVYFVNSGTEATEGAMKLAKRFTGRTEIIAARNAYHGSTQGSASLMSPTTFTQAFYPLLPDIKHINFNCETCLLNITKKTACVIVETIQGEAGVYPPLPDYLQQLRRRCTEVGALLVFDEIQAGYGRTGSLWAFQQQNAIPDILLLAKGMGGGMPIGAFVSSQEIMKVFSFDPILGHITTFGGHPVSAAAGLATLKVLLEEDYISQVAQKEKLFLSLLQHPAIEAVRHAGLWFAVELRDFDFLQAVINECLEQGLITDWFLFNNRSLRIAPPLIITEEQIRWACGVIVGAIDKAAQNS